MSRDAAKLEAAFVPVVVKAPAVVGTDRISIEGSETGGAKRGAKRGGAKRGGSETGTQLVFGELRVACPACQGALRNCPAGYVYHVLNRSAGRIALFRREEDYAAMERVLVAAKEKMDLPLLAWCFMKNHWHFVVRPKTDRNDRYMPIVSQPGALRQ